MSEKTDAKSVLTDMRTKQQKVCSLEDGRKPTVYSYARWSSKPQALGDSERRQIEAAEQWCRRNGLTLSEERFIDSGVSAYRGRNQLGELGRLLEKLQPGNILLVEDADRLSRQGWKATSDFVERVLNKGAELVTLKDGNRITVESFQQDPGVFLRLILSAHLGHSEDLKKAVRVREAWIMKRKEIKEGKAIRQKLPGWLSHEKHFVGGKTVLGKIIVDQAKADTMREIFRLVLAGWGSRRIAKEFNRKGVPTVSGQSARWNGYSLLACIIRNPAVIGDYRVIENKKPTDEIIKGIFPAIVDEKTFYAANAAASGHRKQTTPTAALASNIATGLVRCPTCGGNMSRHRSHKGDGNVYTYLICASTKAGQNKQDCECRPRYAAFESSLLALMADSATLRRALGQAVGEPSEITALRGKLDAADRKLNELMALLEANPSKALAVRVQQLETEAERLRAELQTKEATTKAVTPPAIAYDEFASELAAHVSEPEYRERVKVALRNIIDYIQFHDRTTYTVHFRAGKAVEVWMSEGGFKWQTAKRVGKLMVP